MILQYDEIVWETDNGVQLVFGDEDVWLPFSLCGLDEDNNTIEVPDWMAYRNGLECYEV